VRSQGSTLTQPPHQDFPLNLSTPSRVLCFYTTYLTRDSTALRVCSPGAGFNPPEFLSPCGLPVSCCLATSVVRSRRGPRGLPSPRIFMFLGGMKAAFVPFPSPGPWRARRLDSAVWTLVFGWSQLGLISPVRFPSWSRYILGSGVELN